jgi:energy-converting hydrogenase B subunit D
MAALSWMFDILLVSALLYLASTVLSERDLFKAVVLFIALGLLMALAWVRLHAPDIALAEAAVSAGITGVLMLDALAHLEGGGRNGEMGNRQKDESRKIHGGNGGRKSSAN